MKKSMTGALLVAAVTSGVVSSPASAMTTKQAKRAVAREIQLDYGVRYPDTTCQKFSALRFKCRWHGLSDNDVRNGYTAGWSGTATVRQYRTGGPIEVTPRVTHRGT